ncbi:AAA family ATPase [Brevibacterium linens]|uniref:AAA family ATPase n=1 Tax=Brevibacterium linens TaxID=1703 RepID=UPI00124BABFD|nr:AAA family ATPase [Brevibacterium linens]KAB1947659.1 AAA family ATPase [Brevibacterium linens ATCC 9172]
MSDDVFQYSKQELAEGSGKPATLLDHYGAYNGPWLAQQTFPPTKFVVPGLISEGLSLLIAAPKIGKSWFVLDLADAAARGGKFIDIKVEQRPVLYLATEDVPKRIQERGEILGISEFPSECVFLHRFDPVDTLAIMREFMSSHAGQRPLVIIDTLGKVKPAKGGSQDSYDHDYKTLAAIKGVADEFGGAALVVHHNRKAESEDFIESINGTQGIAGAADTIIVLRRKRGETEAQLHMTSRDSGDEGSYAANFDGGRWSMPGGSLAVAARELGKRESRNALDDDSLAIVEFVNDRESDGYATTAGEVAERMGWDKKKATTYLGRLAENHIRRRARGVYGGLPQGAVVSEVSVVTPEPDETTQTTVTTHPSGNEPILEWGVNPKEQEQAS